MGINFIEDSRSVTELKRKTREILEQVHRTGRPVVVTVNGKADAVLARVYRVTAKKACNVVIDQRFAAIRMYDLTGVNLEAL